MGAAAVSLASRQLSELGEDGLTELLGEGWEEMGLCDGCGAVEKLELHGDLCTALVAVHAEGAGEFVGDGGGLLAIGLREGGVGGGGGDAFEDDETLFEGREVALPEFGDQCVGFGCGFRGHRARLLS